MEKPWWGSQDFDEGVTARWEWGSLAVWARRTRNEWHVAWRHDVDVDAARHTFTTDASFPDDLPIHRHHFGKAPERLTVTPTLAPRSVITRPLSPVHLPPGQSTTFYVGSPLWLKVSVGTEEAIILDEPITPLAETWFGPNTVEGELCFADTTTARVEVDDISFRPFRAVTPLTLKNNDDATLTLERVLAPVPRLALYQGASGKLWTTAVNMERSTRPGSLTFSFGHNAPKEAAGGERIASARAPVSGNVVHQAINAFFS